MAGTFNQPTANPTGAPGQQTQGNQLPEHRLQELEDRLRNAETQNAQLRGTLNALSGQQQNPQGQQQGQTQDPGVQFKPEVQQAIEKMVQSQVGQIKQTYDQALGNVWDQLDEAKYQLKYGTDKFEKYGDKVQQMRNEAISQGRFLSREEALRYIVFEETNKKPTPQPQEPQIQPVWDQNLGHFVHPGTTEPWYPGQPVKTVPQAQTPQVPGQPVQIPGQPQSPQMQTQAQQVPGGPMQAGPHQTPAPSAQQAPGMTTQTPPQQHQQQFFSPDLTQNFNGQQPNQLPNQQVQPQNMNNSVPNLPDATPNSSVPMVDPSNMTLDIGSSTQELDAWEAKYGDIPL